MNGIDRGDTAFMLISSALVLFMTPGLAFFYGGMVRSKNVVNTMMMSFTAMAVVTVQWVLMRLQPRVRPRRRFRRQVRRAACTGSASQGSGWRPMPTTPRRSRTSCS